MRVKFKGIIEKVSKGCNCKARISQKQMVTKKHYYLPSGATKTFRAGVVTDVSDEDGEFLLGLNEFERA